MTTRHTMEPDDLRPEHERVPVAATEQRRGAMYMRAEARRAAELGGVATAPPPPRKRAAPRRMQLAAFAAVWLAIAGVTAVVGVRWARQQRTSSPPVVRTTPTRAPVREVGQSKPAPSTPGQVTSAPPAAAKPVTSPAPVSAPNRAATREANIAATRPVVTSNAVTNVTVNNASVRARSNAVASAGSTGGRTAAAARLVITSNPAGAVVTVDGIGWGTTPAKIGYLPPGAKRVRVTKEGYASREATIRVADGQPASLNVVLQPLRAPAARH